MIHWFVGCMASADDVQQSPVTSTQVEKATEEAEEMNDKLDAILQAIAEQDHVDAIVIKQSGVIELKPDACGCFPDDPACMCSPLEIEEPSPSTDTDTSETEEDTEEESDE